MIRIGVALVVACIVGRLTLPYAFYGVGGQAALNSDAVQMAITAVNAFLPLGVGFCLMALPARILESRILVTARPATAGVTAAVRPAAPTVFWGGVVLSLLGFLREVYLSTWSMASPGNTNIGTDLLDYVVVPASAVVLPFGLLLIPVSFVVAALRSEMDGRTGPGVLGGSSSAHRTRK